MKSVYFNGIRLYSETLFTAEYLLKTKLIPSNPALCFINIIKLYRLINTLFQ